MNQRKKYIHLKTKTVDSNITLRQENCFLHSDKFSSLKNRMHFLTRTYLFVTSRNSKEYYKKYDRGCRQIR